MRDRRMEGQTDGRTEWNQYTPTTSLCEGYNKPRQDSFQKYKAFSSRGTDYAGWIYGKKKKRKKKVKRETC